MKDISLGAPAHTAAPAVLTPRGKGDTQAVNVPNWASTTGRATTDCGQHINSWPEYVLSLLNR